MGYRILFPEIRELREPVLKLIFYIVLLKTPYICKRSGIGRLGWGGGGWPIYTEIGGLFKTRHDFNLEGAAVSIFSWNFSNLENISRVDILYESRIQLNLIYLITFLNRRSSDIFYHEWFLSWST